jgi:hypothetical protein
MNRHYLVVFLLFCCFWAQAQRFSVQQYCNDIRQYGQEPVEFVTRCLDKYDLLVFDDALHSAYEPFVFYNQLINTPSLSGKINFIFLEVINTTSQPLIDSFLNSNTKDSTILTRVFQDDYTGLGWRCQTYLDLFNTVWHHNRQVPDSLKIRIVGVNQPIYWEAIHTWKDYELFQSSLKSRDYFMYLEIVERMKGFRGHKKGLFLCNTRHAYKNVRSATGELYWNTNTFFNERNPGKTFSIRIHNATLSVEGVKHTTASTRKSTEGLNEIVYSWIRMDHGSWDSAFAMNQNKPVALPLSNTSFGNTPYAGNLMLNVQQGTTMAAAYDALIFLAPLPQLHFSAEMSYIYTPGFKPELERRLQLLKGDEYGKYLQENNAADFETFYKKNAAFVPVTPNQLIRE